MKLVLYSLAVLGSNHCERQWVASIRSLRRYNRSVRVRLGVYGVPASNTLAEARRHGVEVVSYGDYRACLAASAPRHARVLAENPTLHKIASMRDLPECEGQVLYLDCDTFCFGDIDILFERYAYAHFHAREEQASRRSPHGYDPTEIDEAALETLASSQGLSFVPPYNTGVMMLNGGLWRRLGDRFATFLEFVLRLSHPGLEGEAGLPYPSSTSWIVEEIATWLTLGGVPGLTHAPYDPGDVAQNGEANDFFVMRRFPRLAHYFSSLETSFFESLRSSGAAHTLVS